jgi:hypothetical protein
MSELLPDVLSENGYNILSYLDGNDIENFRMTNKLIYDICECHEVFSNSFKNVNKLFTSSVENTDFFKKLTFFDDSKFISTGQSFASNITGTSDRSKFKEKYNFNKPILEYYTESEQYKHRLQSARSTRSTSSRYDK